MYSLYHPTASKRSLMEQPTAHLTEKPCEFRHTRSAEVKTQALRVHRGSLCGTNFCAQHVPSAHNVEHSHGVFLPLERDLAPLRHSASCLASPHSTPQPRPIGCVRRGCVS